MNNVKQNEKFNLQEDEEQEEDADDTGDYGAPGMQGYRVTLEGKACLALNCYKKKERKKHLLTCCKLSFQNVTSIKHTYSQPKHLQRKVKIYSCWT